MATTILKSSASTNSATGARRARLTWVAGRSVNLAACVRHALSPRRPVCAQRPASRRDLAATDRRDTRCSRRLYDWTLSLASRPAAPYALAAVSFAESSFFPVPPDVMLVPMVLARPGPGLVLRARSAPSPRSLGGILRLRHRRAALRSVGQWLFRFYGLAEGAEAFRRGLRRVRPLGHPPQGLTPIPYKLVTITSGFAGYDLVLVRGAVDHHPRRAFLRRGARCWPLRRDRSRASSTAISTWWHGARGHARRRLRRRSAICSEGRWTASSRLHPRSAALVILRRGGGDHRRRARVPARARLSARASSACGSAIPIISRIPLALAPASLPLRTRRRRRACPRWR